ncbi:uncharacterized protein F4822DRAFT_415767 [Hypoxylon trugodes]|uniref:uncharacterized protein n=1 Tax=Hypoxylon trugodes TaxID=326681 RepID=UPI00219FDC71|nr:uncharacterized protein F4822DRAFT_415767 [Hypoxylon trugodes]KAI1384640.1 hypothetical protein F4822DRAFT_415767 [Hypoxylon trugodes]
MSSTEAVVPSTADLPSGDPIPSASAAPPSKPRPFPIRDVIAAAPSNIDAFLAHVQRCLQTPSGIDTTLLFLCYASRLSAGILESVSRPAIKRSAQQLLALAASLPPSATLVFTSKTFPSHGVTVILELAKRLRAFSAMLSEVRTFMRLWGLLNMYFWLRRLVLERRARKAAQKEGVEVKKTDAVETTISWFQLSTCIVFQALENGAYLSSKGVLGWSPTTQRRASLWSARFWAAFVGVEVGRLFYESHKRGSRTRAEKFGDGKTAAEVEAEETEWASTWRRTVTRNLAWAPLTLHWSTEGGLLDDLAVGALACVPGVLGIRDLWRRTAE